MNNKTTSEKVQMQYMDMPYPAFSLEQMDNERKYYGDNPINKKEVLLHMPTETLSMINHYLYKVIRNYEKFWLFLIFSDTFSFPHRVKRLLALVS